MVQRVWLGKTPMLRRKKTVQRVISKVTTLSALPGQTTGLPSAIFEGNQDSGFQHHLSVDFRRGVFFLFQVSVESDSGVPTAMLERCRKTIFFRDLPNNYTKTIKIKIPVVRFLLETFEEKLAVGIMNCFLCPFRFQFWSDFFLHQFWNETSNYKKTNWFIFMILLVYILKSSNFWTISSSRL